MLKPLEDNFSEFADALYQMVLTLDDENITKKEIEDMIIDLARALTLGLYDSIAFDSTTKKTINTVDKIIEQTISNRIQKLMMVGFSNGTNAFIDEAINLLKEYPDNNIVKTFVRLIVRVHVIRCSKLDYRQIAKISNEIFCVDNKKEVFKLLSYEL